MWMMSGGRPARGCRSPHGERGLKSHGRAGHVGQAESLSSRRAWIEIMDMYGMSIQDCVALLTESVD